MMRFNRTRLFLVLACGVALTVIADRAAAVDFESFEFNDVNGTQLGSAVNTANPGNAWVVDPDMGGSQTQQALGGRPGSYYVIKSTDTSDNNFLQIANVTSGVRYLTTKISGWNFFETSNEAFRMGFVTGDTPPAFNVTITAQASLVRTASGEVELTGGALGALSSPITSNVTFPAERTTPFEMTLAIDKSANTYEVFYRDGTAPSQVLGMGLIDPARDANAIRMQATGVFGDFAQFFPSEVLDYLAVDRIALTDVNPHADLITLEIDRDNGAMTLRNTSGAALNGIESYSIVSNAGGLNPAGWTPVAGGTTSGTNDELLQMLGSPLNLATNGTLALSNASGAWLKSPFEDVSMVLNLSGGVTRTVNVNFIDNGGLRFATGDLNFDNAITAADYTLLVASAETNLAGLSDVQAYRAGDLSGDGFNSIQDFIQFKTIYEAENGAGSFARMVAGVPEPTTAIMAMVGAVGIAGLRRRRPANRDLRADFHTASSIDRLTLQGESVMPRATCVAKFALLLAALVAFASPARAAILEDFLFNDANGTTLDQTANAANPGNNWLMHANTVESATLNGSFRINKQSQMAQASNALDIANVSTGKVWLVTEIAGWNYTATASSTSERVRFAFMDNNDPPAAGNSTVTAEANIDRSGAGLALRGEALAAAGGATNIANSYALPLVRTTPFAFALELNKDSDQYSIYYKDNTDPYQFLGTGELGTSTTNAGDRDGNSLRFAFTGAFGDTGEFFDVNRIYLTNTNPITTPVDPITLTLEVRSNGQVLIKNETANLVSFDSYRIASGSSSLSEAGWDSLESAGVDSIGPGAGQHWTVAGGSSDAVLAESFLLGASSLDPDEEFSLGSAFKVGGMQDLTFQYRDTVSGSLVSVVPTYVTVAGVTGDYNNDGTVNAADYTVWRDKLGQSFQLQNEGGISPGVVDAADYTFWKSRFGATSGAGSASLSAVPEAGSLALALLAVVPAFASHRRRAA
jgi:hypothetical protein